MITFPEKVNPMVQYGDLRGTDSSNLADYYDPDHTLRNPLEIVELWKQQGINKDDHLAFYCGTGWRASVPWFMTNMMGWKILMSMMVVGMLGQMDSNISTKRRP